MALQIQDVTVVVEGKQILQNISLTMMPGSVHVLMGPNGSGKSTLALSLMGHPAYTVKGSVSLAGIDLQELPTYKRAQRGLFLSFQQPHEIPGVSLHSFLKAAYEALCHPIDNALLKQRVCAYLDLLELDESFYYRNVHEGFSGGERKKLELLQLLLFRPKVAILDELDSGLDIDALRIVAQALQAACKENPAMSLLCITHYQRILRYIQPDHVHVLMQGMLVQSGDRSLVDTIEQYGYKAGQ